MITIVTFLDGKKAVGVGYLVKDGVVTLWPELGKSQPSTSWPLQMVARIDTREDD